MRQRVWAQLELYDQRARDRLGGVAGRAGRRRVDALDVERRPVAGRHPQFTAFPAGFRVVDAAFEPLGEEAHRIGHAQLDDLAADQRMQ